MKPEMALRPKRRRRVLRRIVWIAVLLAIILTKSIWLPAWGRWLDVSEKPQPAEYVMMLGGNSDTRPFVAASLYRSQNMQGVLVPQIKLSVDAKEMIGPSETELIQLILLARGVPKEQICLLPGEVTSTFDEARALATFLETHPDARVAIVTNDFHTRRARRIFRKALGDRAGQIYFVATPVPGVSSDNWWKTDSGFITYVGETFKVGYYAIRY